MRLANFLKTGSFAVLAATMTLTALPVQAAQDGRGSWMDANPQRARQTRGEAPRGNADITRARQQARQIDRSSERQAARMERGSDRAAERAGDRGNSAQTVRVDRRSERAATGLERQGERRAAQVRQEVQRDAGGDRNRTVRAQTRARNQVNRSGVTYNGERGRVQAQRWDRNNANGGDRARNGNRDWDRDQASNRAWDRNNSRYDRESQRSDRSNWQRDRRDNNRWDRNSWRTDRRYDWNGYRAGNRRLYQLGAYYAPYRNYSYRRLGVGFSLDSLFFGSRYWIADPWQYRLPEVYGSYRWIRYYDDVLLVDTYSGEVVDVIHDFFW